jgi:pimeloyl-ACP methyl ester carboxylesterase
MPTIDVPDKNGKKVPLEYEIRGSGIPIVLIHGWLCNKEFWEDFWYLADQGYQVITMDLRGHGKTPKTKAYSIPIFAQDIRDLLDHLKIEKAILIGHSMGGLTAQSFYEQFPERVIALGLWNTGARMVFGYGIGTLAYVFRIVSFVTGLILSYPIPPLFRLILTQGWKLAFKAKGKSAAYQKFVPSLKMLSPTAVLKAAFALAGYDARKVVAAIKVPVMLLPGTADRNITPVQLFDYLNAHIPTNYPYTSDSGHFPPNETPEIVITHLNDFLTNHARK